MAGDLLQKGQRIVIPSSLREEMLNILHQGDEGIVKYRDSARQVSLVARPFSLHKLETVPCAQNNTEGTPVAAPVPGRLWRRVGTVIFIWDKNW